MIILCIETICFRNRLIAHNLLLYGYIILTLLEDLAEALLDFSTEADLVAWLQHQQ
ncbi:DUF4351 domain-containing protein [Nostoc sp.]|uniref:DUF4351 domain-containing protein n=1 Tax=Nostoc sp. TaxID=1180 RepID=UPI002FF4FDE2